jgi:hypothetical protein
MWVSSHIKTDSHILSKESLRLLLQPSSNIRASKIKEREFVLSICFFESEAPSESTKIHQAHHVIKAFLVALNAATLGMFYWSADPWVHPIFTLSDDLEGVVNSRTRTLMVTSSDTFETLKPLDENELQNAIIIFGILARERSIDLESEYSKGLLLLRMNFYDINFRREAFLCFYRAFENFVATRLLKVKNSRMNFVIYKIASLILGLLLNYSESFKRYMPFDQAR